MTARNLAEALTAQAGTSARITFVDRDGRAQTFSYGELHQRALHVLNHFQCAGVQQGDELVICVSSTLGFVDALWACLLGGIIPTPLAVGSAKEHRRKVFSVLARLRRPVLFTERAHLSRLNEFAAEHDLSAALTAQRTLLIEEVTADGGPGRVHEASPDDLALIQFSSGSTGEPKGVKLTHRNILANIIAIRDSAELNKTDSTLSWMPLTHDMGLIGFHLLPIVIGISQTILPPEVFARRPLAWLEQVSAKRATMLGSPNFGYRHVLKALPGTKLAPLDLSCVRLIFNGAEPIAPRLCREFIDALAPHGLTAHAMFPVYGLAEASLAVAFPRPGAALNVVHADRTALGVGDQMRWQTNDSDATLALVSVGAPIASCTVRIVDQDSTPVAAGRVGHVQIRGESVTAGYYASDDPRRDGFTSDGWFDTGDVGALLDGAGLVIVGRHKDTIIVKGQNFHAHDLERLCEEIEGIEPGKVACVGARDELGETEIILAFVQHRGALADFVPVAARIAKAIGAAALDVSHVVPVSSFPKTTSGKIQRFALRDEFNSGAHAQTLAALAAIRRAAGRDMFAMTETERVLKEICEIELDDTNIGLDDDLVDYGADSLALAAILTAIEERYPDVLLVEDLLDYSTIAAVAALIDEKFAEAQRAA